jgi:pimeloyl-ACP methyl ester carboxylesterase
MLKKRFFLLSLPVMLGYLSALSQAGPVISSEMPGGSIRVVKMAADTLWLEPDLTGTEGEWFYWYFRVSKMAGKTLHFRFTLENQFSSFGPAYSINDRQHWKWYGEKRTRDNGFTFSFAPGDTTAWFCTAIPYTAEDLAAFLDRLNNPPLLDRDTLCLTRQNRVTERLFIRQPGREPDARVLITARHHACEMMASYVLEGIMESILNDVHLEYLREHVECMIIPFMDKDGVENGEQGKNRIPRDHNRDYDGISIYRSTAALRKEIPAWSDGKLRLALDLHCPWIKGEGNEWIYLVGKPDPVMETAQLSFCRLLEHHATGELKFRSNDFLPYGTAWNTPENFTKGRNFGDWVSGIDGISLATTIEFPYANVLGATVNKDNARAFGRAVAYAMADYLTALSADQASGHPEQPDWRKNWPGAFEEVEILSSMDGRKQQAMFLPASGDATQPLAVSLHTWSGDYRQQDPLAPLIRERGWNYIHPDFRGSNTRPEACGSEYVIRDIEDAIRFAMENGRVDPGNIHIIGSSGGGYATLMMYMKTSLDIRSFSAWVPISNLVDWYWSCQSRGLKYAGDILMCTGSRDSVLNIEEAKRRSPFFLDTPVTRRGNSILNIYCGIHDGYTGSVPITQSIDFYNKLVRDWKGGKKALVAPGDIIVMLSQKTFKPDFPAPCIQPEGRRIHYRKQFRTVHLTIFEGSHEILPGAAMEDLLAPNQ